MRRYHGQRPSVARQRAKAAAAGSDGVPSPNRPETGIGRLNPENRPEPIAAFPLTVAYARDHPEPELRVSDTNRRYCAFCNRTIEANARVCEVHERDWNAARAQVRRDDARAKARRTALVPALRTLAEVAALAADALDKQRYDKLIDGRLHRALARVHDLRNP